MRPELWVEVSQLRVGEKRGIGKEHSEHVRRPRVSRASSRTERISLGMEQRLPWVGRTARWKKMVSLSQLMQALKVTGSHSRMLSKAVTLSLLCFFSLKDPLTAGFWQLETREKALRSEVHRSL